MGTLLASISPVLKHIPTAIIQHMPPTFTTIHAEQLSRATKRVVKEGETGEIVESGKIYIAPGDNLMLLERVGSNVRIKPDSGTWVNYFKPAIDPIVQSIDQIYGASVLNVILTGREQGGARGAEIVSKTGG